MKNYLKLLNFELNRFINLYLVLIGLTIVSQITGTIVRSKKFVSLANTAIHKDSIPLDQFFEYNQPMSLMNLVSSGWFLIPIALAAAALLFYSFFIWYRDWFGKNTFIYRLLMLPTARINLFFSKLSAIFLMVLGLVATQLILLPIENTLIKWLVPSELRIDLSIRDSIAFSEFLELILPSSFSQFLINYGLGVLFLTVAFTIILFERSFHFKGIFLGGLFGIAAVIFFFSPYFIEALLHHDYLYPIEHFTLSVVLGIILMGISIWISHYLLNKKVTV
ncbi:MAG: hypothetical protein RR548_02225 [Carnobacterium sp.]|uniref:hypothetical protein n=1 Tax=unclassified Carnobacterium TaxID=257487 RepID=UPI001913E2D6|nr:hypothetical protein [Carnobacterium sp. CS13]QQP70415.1 hypothetical protein JHE06_00810 [Carnobacterium sp. CS13]